VALGEPLETLQQPCPPLGEDLGSGSRLLLGPVFGHGPIRERAAVQLERVLQAAVDEAL